MPGATCSAVLLDVDGTLVDTNYLHVDAWSRALEDVGRPADAWRVHRAVGMDSARLLEALLGGDTERLGEQAKNRPRKHYAADRSRMRTFAGARDLLAELRRRGLAVVLATSASPEEFDMLVEVLHAGDSVTASTTSSDVEQAKPEPDVVRVALQRIGVAAGDAVMIGDAVWDVESAARAGVRCVAVRSGGTGAADLSDAGAVAVYDDVAHLLRELDVSPLFRS